MKIKSKAGSRRGALFGVTASLVFLYMFIPVASYILAGPAVVWFLVPYVYNV